MFECSTLPPVLLVDLYIWMLLTAESFSASLELGAERPFESRIDWCSVHRGWFGRREVRPREGGERQIRRVRRMPGRQRKPGEDAVVYQARFL